jgi:hypothetical protein
MSSDRILGQMRDLTSDCYSAGQLRFETPAHPRTHAFPMISRIRLVSTSMAKGLVAA